MRWNNVTLNRRSTSSALREADEDGARVPRFYPAVFSDRDPTAAERRRFDVLLDLGRDADVLVVNRANPVCASGLSLAQARGIARGTIIRWSQVAALPAGQPGAIDRHVRGENGYAQRRFGIGLRPHHAVIEPDGGVAAAYRDPAVAAVTSWSRVRAYTSSVCPVAIDGVVPTDASVLSRGCSQGYPIELAFRHRRRTDPQRRAMVRAYVDFLRSAPAAALLRQAGVLFTADGPPAATPPYQKSSRPAAGL